MAHSAPPCAIACRPQKTTLLILQRPPQMRPAAMGEQAVLRLCPSAIRWHRVRDEAQRLCFVPTHLQRADGLTKNNVSPSQRRLLLHVVESPSIEDVIDDETAYPVSAYLFSGV